MPFTGGGWPKWPDIGPDGDCNTSFSVSLQIDSGMDLNCAVVLQVRDVLGVLLDIGVGADNLGGVWSLFGVYWGNAPFFFRVWFGGAYGQDIAFSFFQFSLKFKNQSEIDSEVQDQVSTRCELVLE